MSDPYRHIPTDPICPLCTHEWRRHDPEDGCCDAHAEEGFGACPCGRNRLWMAGRRMTRQHGRHAIGIELSEEYCKLAADRLSQLSLLAETNA